MSWLCKPRPPCTTISECHNKNRIRTSTAELELAIEAGGDPTMCGYKRRHTAKVGSRFPTKFTGTKENGREDPSGHPRGTSCSLRKGFEYGVHFLRHRRQRKLKLFLRREKADEYLGAFPRNPDETWSTWTHRTNCAEREAGQQRCQDTLLRQGPV